MNWILVTITVCFYGFFKDFRPSEAYLTQYLTSDFKNLTLEQVNGQIYPWWTYSYVLWLIPVFLLTDYYRYKPMLVLDAAAYILTWCLIVWAKGIPAMTCMQVLYGLATAAEIGYYSYLFSMVEKQHFRKVTSFTRCTTLLSRFLAYLLGQFFVSFEVVDLRSLNMISFGCVCVAFIISLVLPKARSSELFNRQNKPLDLNTVENNELHENPSRNNKFPFGENISSTRITENETEEIKLKHRVQIDDSVSLTNTSDRDERNTEHRPVTNPVTKPLFKSNIAQYDQELTEHRLNETGNIPYINKDNDKIDIDCEIRFDESNDDMSYIAASSRRIVTNMETISELDQTSDESITRRETFSSNSDSVDAKNGEDNEQHAFATGTQSENSQRVEKESLNGTKHNQTESTLDPKLNINKLELQTKKVLPSEPSFYRDKTLVDNHEDDSLLTELRRGIKFVQRELTFCFSSRTVLIWSLWWIFASYGNFQTGSYIQDLWEVIAATEKDEKSYNGAVEAAGMLLGSICVGLVGFLPIRWSVPGRCEFLMTSVCTMEAVIYVVMSQTQHIWVAYVLYDVLRVITQVSITVETAEIAKALSGPRYGFVFGCNMFLALVIESLFTVIVVDDAGLGVHVRTQFLVYGIYSFALAGVFGIVAIVTIVKYRRRAQHDGEDSADYKDNRISTMTNDTASITTKVNNRNETDSTINETVIVSDETTSNANELNTTTNKIDSNDTTTSINEIKTDAGKMDSDIKEAVTVPNETVTDKSEVYTNTNEITNCTSENHTNTNEIDTITNETDSNKNEAVIKPDEIVADVNKTQTNANKIALNDITTDTHETGAHTNETETHTKPLSYRTKL